MAQGKKYTDQEKLAITEEVCRRLLEGQNLRQICTDDPEMPALSTFMAWQQKAEGELRNIYTRAQENAADVIVEADMPNLIGRMFAGELDHNSVRVALNNMQWRAARKNPKRYGDRLDARVSGDIIVHGLERIKQPK